MKGKGTMPMKAVFLTLYATCLAAVFMPGVGEPANGILLVAASCSWFAFCVALIVEAVKGGAS